MGSENISFAEIPSSIRKPGKYMEFNTKLAVNTLSQNPQKVLIVGQRLALYIETARFKGGTLNDMTSQGTYTGLVATNFIVRIQATGTPDDMEFSTDNGATWSSPAAVTGSAQALSLGVTVTFGATTGHGLLDEWRFTAWPEPSVAAATPTRIFSEAEAAEQFGYGSMVHIMAKAALKANKYLQLSICALADSGSTKAAGDITITGTATTAGSLKLYIGNVLCEADIVVGDTAHEVALTLQAKMETFNYLPVVFDVDALTGKLDFVAKNAGTIGNDIGIETILSSDGLAVAETAMTSGATNPDVDTALTPVQPEDYNILITPYAIQADLVKVRDHLDLVSGPMEQRPCTSVFGMSGTLAAATTLGNGVNHARIVGAFLRSTRSMPYEIAAAFASVMAFEEDPAMPLNTLELKGLHAPTIANRFTRTEQETLLNNGVSPVMVGPGEKVQIVRAISTYVKDAQGIDDISLLDITSIRTLDYVRLVCVERISLRFPRSKLSTRTANMVRSELYDVLKKLEALEIVENVDDNADELIVEADLQDPNRLNAKVPSDVVNGLHVFAGRIDLIL